MKSFFRKFRRIMSGPACVYHRIHGLLGGTSCPVCARRSVNRRKSILSDELVSAWQLSAEWRARFDDREGTHCPLCGSNRRSQHMASTLVRYANEELNLSCTSLREVTRQKKFHALQVAEFNACGQLHRWLAAHPGLAYSEYKAAPPIRAENLLNLSYPSQSFDLILTSETLEHVPDIIRALAEIFRVLKPDGAHIFTVPVVWDRPESRVCAKLDEQGNMACLQPPSFHGIAGTTASDMMVITEFGADIIATIEAAGFTVFVDRDPENPAICTFVTRRPRRP